MSSICLEIKEELQRHFRKQIMLYIHAFSITLSIFFLVNYGQKLKCTIVITYRTFFVNPFFFFSPSVKNLDFRLLLKNR